MSRLIRTIRVRILGVLPVSPLVIVLLACRAGVILWFSSECESGAWKAQGISHVQM